MAVWWNWVPGMEQPPESVKSKVAWQIRDLAIGSAVKSMLSENTENIEKLNWLVKREKVAKFRYKRKMTRTTL